MGITIDGAGTITGLDADGISAQPVFPGNVLQVVHSGLISNPSVGTTSTTGADVAAYSLQITPSAASSKIFVMVSFGIGAGGAGSTMGAFYQLRREISGSSVALAPDIPNFNYSNAAIGQNAAPSINAITTYNFLDTPNTTAAVKYGIRIRSGGTNSVFTTGAGFHMTLMEIAA